jgi:hypothetical protein
VNIKRIALSPNAAGDYAVDQRVSGQIIAIFVDLGTLSTPDVTVTDLTTGDVILTAAGIAADKVFMPRRLVQGAADGADIVAMYDAPVVLNTAHVVVAGAGNKTSGDLYIAYRG